MRIRIRTTESDHEHRRYPNRIKNLLIQHPDHVWVGDITYIRFGTRFIYLAVILDAYTRAVRGWALSCSIDKQLTTDALRMALKQGHSSIVYSDQGSQYTASKHTDLLDSASVNISMADAGQPTQNVLVERVIRTFKEENLDFADYDSFDDSLSQIHHWFEVVYNALRIHSSLGYLTPTEFEPASINCLPSLSAPT